MKRASHVDGRPEHADDRGPEQLGIVQSLEHRLRPGGETRARLVQATQGIQPRGAPGLRLVDGGEGAFAGGEFLVGGGDGFLTGAQFLAAGVERPLTGHDGRPRFGQAFVDRGAGRFEPGNFGGKYLAAHLARLLLLDEAR